MRHATAANSRPAIRVPPGGHLTETSGGLAGLLRDDEDGFERRFLRAGLPSVVDGETGVEGGHNIPGEELLEELRRPGRRPGLDADEIAALRDAGAIR